MARGRAQGAGFFDRQPWLAPPPVTGERDSHDLDEHATQRLIAHAAGLGHQHNGMPAVRPYTWRPGDAQRDAEVADRLAAVRAHLTAMAHGPTCSCRLCVEQYGPIPTEDEAEAGRGR
jgi:hypothetical protein